MKLKLLVLFAFVLCINTHAQTEKWTLKECVEYAVENNIQIKQTALDTLISIEIIRASKGNFLPSVSASASQNYNFGSFIGQTGLRISRDSRGNNFGLNAGVNLFNGFQNINTKKQAELGLESSRLQLDVLKNNIMVFIANNYLNILFNKENLKIAEEQKEITQKQIDQIQELVNSGMRAKVELLDIQAQLAADEANIVNAEIGLESAILSLAQLLQISHIGLDVEDITVEMPTDELIYSTADEVFEKAVTVRPEIKSAELGIKNSELSTEIAKGSFYPSLRVGGGLGTTYQHSQGDKDVRPLIDPNDPNNIIFVPNGFGEQLENNLGYNAGASLSIPIFNGNRTKTSVNRAIVNEKKAEYRLEQEKQTLRSNIETSFTDAKAALNQYLISKASLKAQDAAFINAEQSYELEAINTFEYEQVRTRFVNAQSSLVRAKYNFIFKSKLLEFYFGIPIVSE
jgi:outer membrane protein